LQRYGKIKLILSALNGLEGFLSKIITFCSIEVYGVANSVKNPYLYIVNKYRPKNLVGYISKSTFGSSSER